MRIIVLVVSRFYYCFHPCDQQADFTEDPIFYLYHTNLDRILWEWQQQDLAPRLNLAGKVIHGISVVWQRKTPLSMRVL
jgi:hypothetical protein